MPIVVYPSNWMEGRRKRRRLDGWPPNFARSEPIDFPFPGYGRLRKEDRHAIKQLTGCNAAIRRHPSWNAKKLTISGPRDKMDEAEIMALGFILSSQKQSPGQNAAPPGWGLMPLPGMPMPTMFQSAYPWPMPYPGWPVPQRPFPPYPNMMPYMENEDYQDSVDSDDMWSAVSDVPLAAEEHEAAKEPEAAEEAEAAEELEAAAAEEPEADDVQYVSGPTPKKVFFFRRKSTWKRASSSPSSMRWAWRTFQV